MKTVCCHKTVTKVSAAKYKQLVGCMKVTPYIINVLINSTYKFVVICLEITNGSCFYSGHFDSSSVVHNSSLATSRYVSLCLFMIIVVHLFFVVSSLKYES